MKVLLHYDAGKVLRERLAQLAEQGLELVCCPEGPDEPFLSELTETEVIWHSLYPISAELINRAPGLKLIQKIGVGVNTIDLEAASARGIAVCNMPGRNSRAVAEMTLLLMLAALRRLYYVDRCCRSGDWVVDTEVRESLGELCGRTVGLVGFGSVPKLLSPILDAMGARVVYTATAPKPVPYEYLTLDQLLRVADIVSLHIPLTPQTDKLLDEASIGLMKPGAVLVNTARGGLIDEHALYRALSSGALTAAGLDVFYDEPVSPNNPLLTLDNVSVAPHVAWLTAETLERSLEVAVYNALAMRDSKPLIHRVV